MDVVKKVIKADGLLGTYVMWLGGCMRLNDVFRSVCWHGGYDVAVSVYISSSLSWVLTNCSGISGGTADTLAQSSKSERYYRSLK